MKDLEIGCTLFFVLFGVMALLAPIIEWAKPAKPEHQHTYEVKTKNFKAFSTYLADCGYDVEKVDQVRRYGMNFNRVVFIAVDDCECLKEKIAAEPLSDKKQKIARLLVEIIKD